MSDNERHPENTAIGIPSLRESPVGGRTQFTEEEAESWVQFAPGHTSQAIPALGSSPAPDQISRSPYSPSQLPPGEEVPTHGPEGEILGLC